MKLIKLLTVLVASAAYTLFPSSPASADVLFDNGPVDPTRTTWAARSPFVIYDDFVLTSSATVTGLVYRIFAKTPLLYDHTIVSFFKGPHTVTCSLGDAIGPSFSSVGATAVNGLHTSNEITPDGYDITLTGMSIPLEPGTYTVGLSTVMIGDCPDLACASIGSGPGPVPTVGLPLCQVGTFGGGVKFFDHMAFTVNGVTAVPTDNTPPMLSLPTSFALDATSPAGATVNYTVTATDNSGVTPTVSCYPLSGTTFAIGPTTVSCTATDAANNSATGSFMVTVNGPVTQLENLIAIVGLHTNPLATRLDDRLEHAIDALESMKRGSILRACISLRLFIIQAQFQSGKKLIVGQANQLIASANQIRAVLGCP